MIDGELMQEIQEAAAKGKTSLHEEKVCKLCRGDKSVFRCFECGAGTGKENAK